jgi:hypothetical protein
MKTFEQWLSEMRAKNLVPFGTAHENFARLAWQASSDEERAHPDGEFQACMSNSELQEAITMANAMTKSAAQYSPTYQALRAHLEKLLLVQQVRAAMMYSEPKRETA